MLNHSVLFALVFIKKVFKISVSIPSLLIVFSFQIGKANISSTNPPHPLTHLNDLKNFIQHLMLFGITLPTSNKKSSLISLVKFLIQEIQLQM